MTDFDAVKLVGPLFGLRKSGLIRKMVLISNILS